MGDDFKIDLKNLKQRSKWTNQTIVSKVDEAGERQGFVQRSIQGKRGRPKSDRTGQVHAKVMPDVADEIASESVRRGVTQGVIIEEAWQLYKDKNQ